eukprot:8619835-Ditylum_brightwellii.AAC.2
MRKQSNKKAKTDKENAKVFGNHSSKVFNSPDPLPCDDMVLPLVRTWDEFTKLGTPPSYDEVRVTIMRMANGKSPGPSKVMLDAFRPMVWCKADPNKEGDLNVESW